MKKRILVVEGDQALARALIDYLTDSGFDVEAVEGGKEVLAAARAFRPDLVLLDVMLSGTNGFDFDELDARLRAQLRRARRTVVRVRLGEVAVDFKNLRAHDPRGPIHLTRREFDLLFYLAERRGMVVYRSELLREIWGYPAEPTTRAVDYAVKRLRQKLEIDPHEPRYITTVRGDGYSLTFEEDD